MITLGYWLPIYALCTFNAPCRENDALDYLQLVWTEIPLEIRGACIKESDSYSELKRCVLKLF